MRAVPRVRRRGQQIRRLLRAQGSLALGLACSSRLFRPRPGRLGLLCQRGLLRLVEQVIGYFQGNIDAHASLAESDRHREIKSRGDPLLPIERVLPVAGDLERRLFVAGRRRPKLVLLANRHKTVGRALDRVHGPLRAGTKPSVLASGPKCGIPSRMMIPASFSTVHVGCGIRRQRFDHQIRQVAQEKRKLRGSLLARDITLRVNGQFTPTHRAVQAHPRQRRERGPHPRSDRAGRPDAPGTHSAGATRTPGANCPSHAARTHFRSPILHEGAPKTEHGAVRIGRQCVITRVAGHFE